jgi:crossover junction endodeoxyribonuclease RuvC
MKGKSPGESPEEFLARTGIREVRPPPNGKKSNGAMHNGAELRKNTQERMTILRIDPGKSGAVAVLDETGQLLAVEDMPSLFEANVRSATNAPLLAGLLARTHARIAFCEFVGVRPTDAKVAAFAFGRARGVIEGCAGALGLPIVFLTPPTWKRLADIPPGAENKDLARTRAIARWPARADLFARKCDVDRAEACLIALAGLKREARNV